MRSLYRHISRLPLSACPRAASSFPTRFKSCCAPLSSLVSPVLTFQGEKGTQYRLVCPLGTQVRGKRPRVWLAVDASNDAVEYVVKRPSDDEGSAGGTPSDALRAFKHELEMQRLFQKDPMIRTLVDYIPDSEPGGPMMVLEAFTHSLWEGRNARPFTTEEIKWIMKGVLLDLKMENVVLGGFDPFKPNENIRELIVRLADCSSITKPSTGEVTSLTYRSPEVHFGKPWDQSWGIILAQLLQAQVDHKSPGIYDSNTVGTVDNKAKAVRDKLAIDFDLGSHHFYAEDKDSECSKTLPPPQPEEAYMWANDMIEKVVAREDVQFLVEVLHPDPNARLTVREILDSGYLEC